MKRCGIPGAQLTIMNRLMFGSVEHSTIPVCVACVRQRLRCVPQHYEFWSMHVTTACVAVLRCILTRAALLSHASPNHPVHSMWSATTRTQACGGELVLCTSWYCMTEMCASGWCLIVRLANCDIDECAPGQ